MRPYSVTPRSSLKGEVVFLGDKSIACRSIIISAISESKTLILNFPASGDSLSAIRVLRGLGIKIRVVPKTRASRLLGKDIVKQNEFARLIAVYGRGLQGLKRPHKPLFCGDSGTILRLILGVLAGQNFPVTLKAGKSLSRRPMLRVTLPLRQMGAQINSSVRRTPYAVQEEYPPIAIKGGGLKSIKYQLPVASAQVKSAILLAGLYAKDRTTVIEPVKTRDHTERMLKLFKADIKVKGNKIVIKGRKRLVSPRLLYIPGDISSASFFIVLAALMPRPSRILIRNLNLNPTRWGIIKVLKRMGAHITIHRCRLQHAGLEPVGDLVVKNRSLRGVTVKKNEIPSLIDELPILMVAASFAKGKTVFDGVGELRVKETDRISSMSHNLKKMGADIRIISSGKTEKIVIHGRKSLKGTKVRSFGDHRTAMSMVVASLLSKGTTKIDDISCINKSFPQFFTLLKRLFH